VIEIFPPELRPFLKLKENEEQEQELASEFPQSTDTEPPSVKLSKPRKKKKSPLMEAAELSELKPKKLPRKRKKSWN
jgi:hypothetical protein